MSHPLYTPKPLPRCYKKMIVWDRKAKLFFLYLNGEPVGQVDGLYAQAEATLNQLVYELLKTPTA